VALEDELRDRRARIAAATTRKVRAEAEHESAVSRFKIAKETLASEHGVTSMAEGREKLAELKTALETALVEADTKLKESGA
jgi:hypothetical protein